MRLRPLALPILPDNALFAFGGWAVAVLTILLAVASCERESTRHAERVAQANAQSKRWQHEVTALRDSLAVHTESAHAVNARANTELAAVRDTMRALRRTQAALVTQLADAKQIPAPQVTPTAAGDSVCLPASAWETHKAADQRVLAIADSLASALQVALDQHTHDEQVIARKDSALVEAGTAITLLQRIDSIGERRAQLWEAVARDTDWKPRFGVGVTMGYDPARGKPALVIGVHWGLDF